MDNAQRTSDVYDWPSIRDFWQIEQKVEDDLQNNKNK